MDSYGPPAPTALNLIGKFTLDQKEREQQQRRMALAGALMNQTMSPGAGAFEGLMSGVNKGLGTSMFLNEVGKGRKDPIAPSNDSLWAKGIGEAAFGPDKIGFRDGIRGLFGLPK